MSPGQLFFCHSGLLHNLFLRLNYMHFSQFGMALEQMPMEDFEYLARYSVPTVPPCVSTLTSETAMNK